MLVGCFFVMVLGDGIAGRPGAWAGGFIFFGYVGWANWWYARELFIGRAAARKGDFPRAVKHLEAALVRFEALALVDRLRMVLMFTPTGTRYRESALLALAHCHALAGHADTFLWFDRCVAEYPKSSSANASLMLLRMGARIAAQGGRVDDLAS